MNREKLDILFDTDSENGDVAGHEIKKARSKCSNLLFVVVVIAASKSPTKQLALAE